MNIETLDKARTEALRFVEAVDKVEIIRDKYQNGKPWVHIKDNTKESAACKRASMDLSRALTELRKH